MSLSHIVATLSTPVSRQTRNNNNPVSSPSPFTPIRRPKTDTRRLTTIYTTQDGTQYTIIAHWNRNPLVPQNQQHLLTVRFCRLITDKSMAGVVTLKAIVGKETQVSRHDLQYVDKLVVEDFYTKYTLEYRDTVYP